MISVITQINTYNLIFVIDYIMIASLTRRLFVTDSYRSTRSVIVMK